MNIWIKQNKLEIHMELNLSNKEIAYFYDLLYRYEHESHAGYNDDEMIKKVDVIIDDKYNQNDNIACEKINTIKFSPYYNNKCWGILYHVRNALAHGNIESVTEDNCFLIKDYSDKRKRQKCNMLAKIEKEKFYQLIKAIETTRKNNSKNKNK